MEVGKWKRDRNHRLELEGAGWDWDWKFGGVLPGIKTVDLEFEGIY